MGDFDSLNPGSNPGRSSGMVTAIKTKNFIDGGKDRTIPNIPL